LDKIEANRLVSVTGAINWDTTIFVARFPGKGEEVRVARVEDFSGGKGANVAVAAARILGKDCVAFLGALGEDGIYRRQLQELKSEGVNTEGVVRIRGSQSGQAYVIVDSEGNKTIHTLFGANERILPGHLSSPKKKTIILRTGVLVIMDPPLRVSAALVSLASSLGIFVIFSPGVRAQEGLENLDPTLRNSNLLVLDRVELENLTKEPDPRTGARRIEARYPQLQLIVTLGDEGALVPQGKRFRTFQAFDLATIGKRVVNTTGCGDAFLGVLASYLHLGNSLTESIRLANLAGALKASRYETRGSPTKRDLEAKREKLRRLKQWR
jgi:ribokinase